MAGKVNTKFVVVLSVVMVGLLVGALGLSFWIKGRNADDLIKQGDAKLAAKDFEGAERAYSKAVNKEQTNVAYMEKWLACIEAWAPDTQTRFFDQYRKYVGVKRNVARLKITDIAAHRQFIDLLFEPFMRQRFSTESATSVITEVERSLELIKGKPVEAAEGRVLRRYRGIVRVRMMGEPGVEVTPEQRAEAKADLEAAIAADPKDGDSAIALMNWNLAQAEPLRKREKTAEADAFDAAGRKALADYVTANPDNATAQVTGLLQTLEDTQQAVPKDLSVKDRFDATRAKFAKLKPRLDELNVVFQKAPTAELTQDRLNRFRMVEQYIDPDAKSSRTAALVDRVAAARPDDGSIVLLKAQLLADAGDTDAAIDELQKIVDMPRKPVSGEGVRLFEYKNEALYTQVGHLFQKWETAQDPAEKTKLLDRVAKQRAVMVQVMPEDAIPLLFVDAMTSYAKGETLAARQLLARFNEATANSNISSLWAQAQTELKLNNIGTARDLLERITMRRGDLPGPHVMLAQIDFQLKNPEAALRRLKAILTADPNFEPAKQLEQQIKTSLGQVKASDPVVEVAMEADRLLQGNEKEPPDVAAAEARLKKAIEDEKMTDARLFLALGSLQMQLKRIPDANATLRKGLQANPDNKDLQTAIEELNDPDPVGRQVRTIDASSSSPLDKLLQKGSVYATAGRDDDALKMLAEAAKLAPDDPSVIDRQFVVAIRMKDFDAAAKLVEQATAKNIDRAGGALFRGRLLAAQGRNAEAAAALEEAAKSGAANLPSLRVLGRLYAQLGRFADAERTFRDALRLQPTDVPTIVDIINCMTSAGRKGDALTFARENERIGQGFRMFTEVWLDLEAEVGLRTGIPETPNSPAVLGALERREQMLTREPDNTANKLKLARMYIEMRRWADARSVVDDVKTRGVDPLDVVLLEARLRAEQKDLPGVQAVMDDYIKAQDPKTLTVRPFAAFVQMLSDREMYNEAIAMGERGRAYQLPATMDIDRQLGDMLSNIGRPELAVPYYTRVVDGKADSPDDAVRLRLVEILTGLGKYKESAGYLDGVKAVRADAVIPLLRADVAAGLGDDKRARELYDKAIADFATEPNVYFRRAQFFLRKTPPLTTEAMQDLDAAIKVRPTFWQALRARALVSVTMGRRDDAIRDLREALRVNNTLDDMRLSLMREMIGMGRASEAGEIADEALKARPNDATLAAMLSTPFLNASDWQRAQQYAGRAWELDKQRMDVAYAYLNALLNATPMNIAPAEKILLKDLKDKVSESSGLLVARAKVLAFRNRMPDALKDLSASTNVVPLDPASVQEWWTDVRRVLTKPEEAMKFLERRDVPRFLDWAAFLRASMLSDAAAFRSKAPAAFKEIVDNAKDEGVKLMSYRQWGSALYRLEQYQEAADAWKKGMDKYPEDPELANNLSYVTAKFLKKPEEAIPYAKKAIEISPTSADAFDTLGFAEMAIGKLEEADKSLRTALAFAKTTPQKLAVALHQGQLAVLRKDKDRAKRLLKAVDDYLTKNPELATTYKAEAEELRKQVETP